MIDALNSTATTTAAAATTSTSSTSSSTTSAAGSNSILGKDDFLKMLIAQMKNQDPMNPMDSTQYAAQLAQFSSLEQLQNLNTSMTQSINANLTLTQSINNTLASTLIGKDVKIGSSTISNSGQSSVNLGYTLPSNAASASASIYDSMGNVVKTIDSIPIAAGDHQLSWNFTDNNGNSLADGDYTFQISAKDSSGNDITADPFTTGTISGIKFSSSGTQLMINNAAYQLSDVQEILGTGTNGGN